MVYHAGALKINLKNRFLALLLPLFLTLALFSISLLLNLEMSLFNLTERLSRAKKNRIGFVLHRVNLKVLQNHVEVVELLFLELVLLYVTGLEVDY